MPLKQLCGRQPSFSSSTTFKYSTMTTGVSSSGSFETMSGFRGHHCVCFGEGKLRSQKQTLESSRGGH